MRRTRIVGIGVLVVAAACSRSGEQLPVPTLLGSETGNLTNSVFSPDGSQVAYWSASEKGRDLTVAGADLSNPRRLATNQVLSAPPVWAPDGKEIAFSTDAVGVGDIGIVSATGGEVRRVTDAPGLEVPEQWDRPGRLTYVASGQGGRIQTYTLDPSTGSSSLLPSEFSFRIGFWSPDGSHHVSTVRDQGRLTLWLADSTGSSRRQLTHDGQEVLDGPPHQLWSPDGKELVYISRRTGTGDVWIMSVNGDSTRQVTHDIRDDYAPALSADGKWVAFLSNRGRQTDVWVVPAAGGTELRVTDDEAGEGNLQWVGKGQKLAYHTGQSAQKLVAINVDDGSERMLTPDSIRIGGFDVSLDGQQIVYQIQRGGGVSDLAVMPVAGGESRTIVTGTAVNSGAQWSPDGKRIVFVSNRSGSQDIWILDATGGALRQLTDWPSFEQSPQWSLDGKTIYFSSDHESSPLLDIWSVPAEGGAPKRVTTVGTVQGFTVSRNTPDILVTTIGAKAGQFITNLLMPDGSLRVLWDQGNSYGGTQLGFFAGGDSLGITADLPGGGRGSFLISKETGKGHQILGPGEQIDDVSPDGTQMTYRTGGANPDLALYSLKDGSTRRLTNTPETEAGFWWAGPTTIVVNRIATRRRIAVVDIGGLLRSAAGR